MSRQYANYGELSILFEARVSEQLGCKPSEILLTGSGTAAITAAILATAGRAETSRPYCLAAGYSFVAGALAAEQCGYHVHFVDIDPVTWSVSTDMVRTHPALDQVGVILVTAPYGIAPQIADWDAFSARTGIPVILDAAASVAAFVDDNPARVGRSATILSFHATKALACGEGGAILSTDENLLARAAASLNFGFAGVRETSMPGFNGKMSEYHAAVGLAELDMWDVKRSAMRRVADAYRGAGAGAAIHAAPHIAGNYVLLEVESAQKGEAVRAALGAANVDTRLWYGTGLHRQPHFAQARRDPLPGVEDLAPRLIGMPMAQDLAAEEIDRIMRVVAAT